MTERTGLKNKRIFIVDDHPVFRYGLSQLIGHERGMEVCGEAEGSEKALQLIKQLKPDLVIVDISLEGPGGLELTADLTAYDKKLPVLIVSMHDEAIYAERALRQGARGYVMKQKTFETVITAIKKVLQGGIYLSDGISDSIIGRIVSGAPAAGSPLEELTDREVEVLRHISEGKSSREIASKLNLSVNTINTYRERIKQKYNLKNYIELQRFAIHLLGDTPGK